MRNFRWWSAFSSWPTVWAWVLGVPLLCQPARAVVNSEVTRLIFNAGENSVSLALSNSEQQPTLVQVWADEGDPRVAPDQVKTPVVVIPPVFKMQPGELRSVKLLLTQRAGLASDRETLYWLNIFQIPPMTSADQQRLHKVVLPLRIRMKLFIRPDGVAPPAEKDGEKLRFTFMAAGQQLLIDNPTPWFLTLSRVQCGAYHAAGLMVAPKSRLPVDLQGAGGDCRVVNYELINDSGNGWSYDGRPVSQSLAKNPRRPPVR
ncbi:fimbria/pilus periplasmic chaperone [Entomohabitans teleogrylli]|uniref:fimbria/pilus periplasmic chaperone n=1 Tax=Entomohabitans teleogrylli TaxID=1384589 RepID=UPI00073D350F|nr:fimbria/pilus periplasmic chaperone [Entomohabitans teleogrylli]